VLLVVIATVAPPLDEITTAGAESDLLRAILADEPITQLAAQARTTLEDAIGELLAAELRRHHDGVPAVDESLAPWLRAALARVQASSAELATRRPEVHLGDAA
jgi:hypothetical protein